ncbi:MAG: non-ribosomal peptide synthetase, partial [Verrucomicrobia bacterium]|nr:non-ribosomal peptide synthetase [Verrucomicrobiota bacterium]
MRLPDPLVPPEPWPGIIARFEQGVAVHPEAMALVTPEVRLTYDALNRRANRLANTLLGRGIHPGDVVALGVQDPSWLVAGFLGVLKSGGAVVFLDPKSPPPRIQEILSDSGAHWRVTAGGPWCGQRLMGHPGGDGAPDPIEVDDLADSADANPVREVTPGALMLVGYTSGTSGKPRGIRRSLSQGLFEVGTYLGEVPVGPGDRLLLGMSFTYGASTRFALSALLSGATLCVAGPETLGMEGLVRASRTWAVTQFYTTPSLFRHFCRAAAASQAPETLRVVTLMAEPLLSSDLLLFRQLMGCRGGTLLNSLGSTECGVYCQFALDSGMTFDGEHPPVGPAVPGKHVFLVDENRRPIPAGIPGEIAVSSPYLDQVFWRRPDLDAQLLIPHPERPGERIFYTGDLGVLGADGRVRILGRRDAQVKIRGHRVEPAEIESALCRHPGIRGAVVLATSPPGGQRMLIAYLQRNPEGARPSRRDLDRHLLDQLPAYMVPARFLEVDEFPLTDRGKVDRRALPGVATRPWESTVFGTSVAEDPVMAEVARLWADLLGAEPPHSGAGFFEMGGDSIMAM